MSIIIVEASKCSLQSRLAGQKPMEKLQFVSEGRLLTEVSLLCVRSFFFFFSRSLTVWVRPTLHMEDSLLYSESVEFNLIHKNTFMQTRIVFDQISGYCGLAKLTCKIKHFSCIFGSQSDLGTCCKGFYRGITWPYLFLLLFL